MPKPSFLEGLDAVNTDLDSDDTIRSKIRLALDAMSTHFGRGFDDQERVALSCGSVCDHMPKALQEASMSAKGLLVALAVSGAPMSHYRRIEAALVAFEREVDLALVASLEAVGAGVPPALAEEVRKHQAN